MGLTCRALNDELNNEKRKVDLYDLLCTDRFLRSLNLSIFPKWIVKHFLQNVDITANVSLQNIKPEKSITGSIFKDSGKELKIEIVRRQTTMQSFAQKQPSDPVQIYIFKENGTFIGSVKKLDKSNFNINLGHCNIHMKVEKRRTVVAKEYDNYDFDLSSPSFVITTKYSVDEEDQLVVVEKSSGYE